MNLDDTCRYLGYLGTGNGDMRASKEVVRQKIDENRRYFYLWILAPGIEPRIPW